ncbi:ion channel protein [Leifsonia poae]|uniref:ion channel protein n=1 Tax=Leifsonia poae TaxID=110933 RepID=UPI001CBFEEB4|nr:ion channel protein [Leifsonia poae]
MSSTTTDTGAQTVKRLLALSLPSLIIGIVSALTLTALDGAATLVQSGLWERLPRALGIDPDSGWWTIAVLTATGIAVGLVIWLVPGHGGQDSATTELVAAPPRPLVLPSLALVTLLALAGGVSLGPENPIIAINTGLLVWLVARVWRSVPTELVVLVTAAGTIGAMFGTPVAAALVFTGIVAALKTGGALWDRLFLPLVAAAAGSLTATLLTRPQFALPLPAYTAVHWIDLVSAAAIGVVAALVGLAGVFLFPHVHRAFHSLRNPLLITAAGGLVLGLLGALGGRITLFKGLEQMGELVSHRGDYSAGAVLLIVAVKLVALLVSAGSGFRGGRIFPSVFVGAAVGVLATALVPGIPPVVAVGAGILGMTLAVSRDGWIALFIAVAATGSIVVLPLLCLVILPTWLLVTKAPEMLIRPLGVPPRDVG